MATLYDAFLPLVQSLNDYGGNFTSIHIREAVLDSIEAGAAANDAPLLALQAKLLEKMEKWKGLQDHKTFSALFETCHEAVFYLIAAHRQLPLHAIPAGSKEGNRISKPLTSPD